MFHFAHISQTRLGKPAAWKIASTALKNLIMILMEFAGLRFEL
jgi:hypothetical protein